MLAYNIMMFKKQTYKNIRKIHYFLLADIHSCVRNRKKTVSLLFACKQQLYVFADNLCKIWSRGYKTLFMLNSTEHDISTAHKS